MDDEPSQPAPAPEPDGRDSKTRAGDLARLADASADATYGEDEKTGRAMVPGVLSGDVGPKGRVSAQLRGLSRRERATYGEVPRGAVAPGGNRFLLLPMLGIPLLLLALVALVGWLVSR